MIHKASEHITAVLKDPELVAIFGNERYWELAEETTDPPFLTFSVKALPPETKEGYRPYDVELEITHNTLAEASLMAEQISEIIKKNQTSPRWKDQGGEGGYYSRDKKLAFNVLKFNFKL